ncbi:MAG: biopolymer transporter ExbD [Alphaproteobacteria bacterium]|nr:MAG: biopolymer transporter ExbD [Alphaproteobacteria bacterium]
MSHTLRRRARATSATADMTAMLDVVFILLIFFIVTASFVKETGLVPNMSKPMKGLPARNEPIAFQVDANNRLFHLGRLIDPWSIEPIVRAENAARPEAPVVIETDRNAHTRMMVRIYDEALKAGIAPNKVAVVVKD